MVVDSLEEFLLYSNFSQDHLILFFKLRTSTTVSNNKNFSYVLLRNLPNYQHLPESTACLASVTCTVIVGLVTDNFPWLDCDEDEC